MAWEVLGLMRAVWSGVDPIIVFVAFTFAPNSIKTFVAGVCVGEWMRMAGSRQTKKDCFL